MGEIALCDARQRGLQVLGDLGRSQGDPARQRATFLRVKIGGDVSLTRRGDPLPD